MHRRVVLCTPGAGPDRPASDSWEWVHLAQFVGVLAALGGLIVLHRVLRARAPGLSVFAAGLTVAAAAVWAVLQAVDGITLKQAVDAWAAADGPDEAVRFIDAEIVRWTEWGAQSYFRLLLGLALLLFRAAILTTHVPLGGLDRGPRRGPVGRHRGRRGLQRDPADRRTGLPGRHAGVRIGVLVAATRGRVSQPAAG